MRNPSSSVFASLFSVIAGIAALCIVAPRAEAQVHRQYVFMYDFEFSINPPGQPIEQAVINVGDEVIWFAYDDLHNAVACVGQAEFWEAPLMFRGETFAYTFTIPGVYTYYCVPHGADNGDGTADGMQGTVTVLPAPGGLGVFAAAGVALCRRRRKLDK
jgi:plastocyanin